MLPLHGRGNKTNGTGEGVEFLGYEWPWRDTSRPVPLWSHMPPLHLTHNFDLAPGASAQAAEVMFVATKEGVRTIDATGLIVAPGFIDPHTHIRCEQPSAPDLAALMSYHWVQTELIAVGMPRADLDPSLPPEERVRRSIPYLRRMRNTAMAWCFYRILADLYGFAEPDWSNPSKPWRFRAMR